MTGDRRPIRHLLPILIYLAGFCLFVFPSLGTFTTHLISGGGDGSQGMWSYWWMRFALSHGTVPWYTDFLYHPEGVTLFGAVMIPFNGFLSIPLCWFVDQVTAYNLLIVFSFVATGYTSFLLAREVTGTWWPSVFGGAVVTFSPFHFGHIGGHMHMVAIEWLPFFLFAWLRFLRQPGHGRAVFAAAVLFLVLSCDYYGTFYSVLVGSLMFAWMVLVGGQFHALLTRRGLATVGTFVATSLLLCGPFLGGLIYAFNGESLHGAHNTSIWRNDLLAFLIPGSGWRFYEWTQWYWGLHPAGGNWLETGSHVGLSVLVVCTYGVFVLRRQGVVRTVGFWVVLAALAYVFSLGNELLILGTSYPGVPMPYRLVEAIPGLSLSGTPVRMMLISYIALAVLSAFAIGQAWSRLTWSRRLLVPFVILFALDYWPRPPVVHRPPIPPVIEQLRDMPPGAVAGFHGIESRGMFYQTIFHKPITGGYIARVPQRLREFSNELDSLRLLGRYRELMQRSEATYLLRDRAAMLPVGDAGLKLVAVDDYFELFAVMSSPLPAIPRPAEMRFVRQLPSEPGGDFILEVHAPGDPSCEFACVFALTKVPPRQVFYGFKVELSDDSVFHSSANRHNDVFRGNWGVLDDNAKARITIDRKMGATGCKLWCSLFVFENDKHDAVRRIFRPVALELR